MNSLNQLPEWLGTALLGAIIAALGYVAKLFLEYLGDLRSMKHTRRARLVELYSILLAGKAAYNVQCENRDRLLDTIIQRNPDVKAKGIGFEKVFASVYPTMTEDEKSLHSIIRAITESTLYPLNESALNWLREDTYFKAITHKKIEKSQLVAYLIKLEAHLLLWFAKYKVWIPDHPEHSLVYLVDEEKHGVGFPVGIEKIVENYLRQEYKLRPF
jgi:hypothetical protein